MWKFAGIAAGLALASGVTIAAGPGQPSRHVQTVQAPRTSAVWVEDAARSGVDDQQLVRRLRVLAGRGVELGISIRDLDSAVQGSATGAQVEGVREGSAAEKAGIKKGDIITEFDGERVRSARQLSRLVSETPEGRTVKAGLLRDGKRVDLSVTPETGERASGDMEHGFQMAPPGDRFERRVPGPDARRFFFDMRPPHGPGPGAEWFAFENRRGRLGVRIQDLTPQLAEYFGTTDGVLVSSVDEHSPAAKAGLKAGDVITSVNGKAVQGGQALVEAVQAVDAGGELTIGYVRDRKSATAKATLDPREEPKVEMPAEPI
jgi:serine protease Do